MSFEFIFRRALLLRHFEVFFHISTAVQFCLLAQIRPIFNVLVANHIAKAILNIEHFYKDTQLFKQILMSLRCCSGALFLFEQLMEKLNFEYFLKNILTPNNTRYNLKLIKNLGSPQNVLGSLLLSNLGRKVGTGKDYL